MQDPGDSAILMPTAEAPAAPPAGIADPVSVTGQAGTTKFEALRAGMLKGATSFKERANAAALTASKTIREKDWSREQQALTKVRQGAIEAADKVAKGTTAAWQRTAEGLKKVFGGPLAGIAKQESSQRPCPRLMLVCCTAIVGGGLAEPGVFREHANEEDVYCLYGAFENAAGLVLPPTGTSPHVLAAVIKKFLITLPEPLLTFRLLPEFIAAAKQPSESLALLPKMPQVNFNSLHMLLETLFRVSEFQEHNGMPPASLAEELAPCLAWHPVVKQKQGGWPFGGGGGGGEEELMEHDGYLISPRVDLAPEEMAAITAVLEHLVSNFRTWSEGIVFT